MATELLLRAKRKFNINLAVRDLFLYPTVASLAKYIDSCLVNNGEGNGSQRSKEDIPEQQIDLLAEVERHDLGVMKYVKYNF